MQAEFTLSGPALRLHLLELYLAHHDARGAMALAKDAETWIVGSSTTVRIPEVSTEALAARILAESERAAKVEAKTTGPWASDAPPPVTSPCQSPRPLGKPQPGKTLWSPEMIQELERLVAAGLPYKEIAARLGGKVTTATAHAQAHARGITEKYPRIPGGKLLYTPYPLDAPWPPPADVVVDTSPRGEDGDRKAKSDRDERAQRTCLKCGKLFNSESAGNRICKTCTPAVNAAYEPPSAKVSV